jgi:predicted nucleic acid-binding protein
VGADVARLERDLPAGDRILLDTTLLAAFLDATEATHPVARHVLTDLVRPGRNPAIVSMISVMEILVRPLRRSPPGHYTVLDFLRDHPNLDAVPLDLQMAQDAAWLRAEHRFRPPDALVLATATACQVGHVVTNDHDWSAKLARLSGRLAVVVLDDYLER